VKPLADPKAYNKLAEFVSGMGHLYLAGITADDRATIAFNLSTPGIDAYLAASNHHRGLPGASTVYVFDMSCGQLVHGQPGALKKIAVSGPALRYLGDLWEILFSGQAGIPISTRESPGALRNRLGRAREWLDKRGIQLVANESHRIGIGKDGRITYQPSGTLHIPSIDLI
jgi:hypothetical protein